MSDPGKEAVADTAPKYSVPGLQRGLQILRAFNRNRREIGAPEIARELDIPRSTVFRLMQTLEHLGFLQKVENGTDYRLGIAVLSLGFEYLSSLEVSELARPIIEKLRDETSHTAHLVLRDGGDIVFVVKAVARTTFASSVTIGTRLPAHGTILGRLILADLSPEELDAIYPDGTLEKFSPQTPATLDELKSLLAVDRVRDYAISQSYYERGIASVAAPVRDQSGRVIAAINMTFQDGTVAQDELEGPLLDAVRGAAETLSAQLNYHPGAQGQSLRQAG